MGEGETNERSMLDWFMLLGCVVRQADQKLAKHDIQLVHDICAFAITQLFLINFLNQDLYI